MIDRICIIGTGLIGGSFALALKQAGFSGHITGSARSQSTLDEARARGVLDSGSTDPAVAVDGADLVMITVPMLAAEQVLEAIAGALAPNAIVTDGGSVKGSFVAAVRRQFTDFSHVVPGHPIAGREHSGVAAAQVDLYQQKRVLLTPLPETRPEAVEQVKELWEMAGALVESIDVDTHDRALALTSHLPHVLAFALVDTLATRQQHEEIFRYAAGGFGDFTRIASGDPVMWRDICLTNRDEISASLTQLLANLEHLKNLIDAGEGDELKRIFTRAKQTRDNHVYGNRRHT